MRRGNDATTSRALRRAVALSLLLLAAGSTAGCITGGENVVVASSAVYPVSLSRSVRNSRGEVLKIEDRQVVAQYQESFTGWFMVWTLVPVGGRELDISESINKRIQEAKGDGVVNLNVQPGPCGATILGLLAWLPFIPTCNTVVVTGDVIRVPWTEKDPNWKGEPTQEEISDAFHAVDSDRDTFINENDSCPDEPEVFNDISDDDGCPDQGGSPLIALDQKVEETRIIVFRRTPISLPKNYPAEITERGIAQARAIAAKLIAHLDWKVKVGFKPKKRYKRYLLKARRQAEALAGAIRFYARRDSAAEVADWREVRPPDDPDSNKAGIVVEKVTPGDQKPAPQQVPEADAEMVF